MSEVPSAVSVWKAQVVAGAGTLFSFLGAGMLVAGGHAWLAIPVLPFAAVSVLLLLVYGPIQADQNGIWMDGSLESVGIAWTDVRQIRFGKFQLVIEGEGKRLVLPRPCFWTGPGSAKVLEYLRLLARDYCPPPPPSRTADLVLSRNVLRIAPPSLK
ncbi:MAG: hypothetical protein QM691_02830 [Opitutaceae bacterium]